MLWNIHQRWEDTWHKVASTLSVMVAKEGHMPIFNNHRHACTFDLYHSFSWQTKYNHTPTISHFITVGSKIQKFIYWSSGNSKNSISCQSSMEPYYLTMLFTHYLTSTSYCASQLKNRYHQLINYQCPKFCHQFKTNIWARAFQDNPTCINLSTLPEVLMLILMFL